jgi:hypothetical protein
VRMETCLLVGGPAHGTVVATDAHQMYRVAQMSLPIVPTDTSQLSAMSITYHPHPFRDLLNGHLILLCEDHEITKLGALNNMAGGIDTANLPGIFFINMGARRVVRAMHKIWEEASRDGFTLLPGVKLEDVDDPAHDLHAMKLTALAYRVRP